MKWIFLWIYCPPYEIIYQFAYDKNTIVLYHYRFSCLGVVAEIPVVKVITHNRDGTVSFTGGSADFKKYSGKVQSLLLVYQHKDKQRMGVHWFSLPSCRFEKRNLCRWS